MTQQVHTPHGNTVADFPRARIAELEPVLPAALDGATLVALVADRLEVEVGRPLTLDRVLLDTVDGRRGRPASRPSDTSGKPIRRR